MSNPTRARTGIEMVVEGGSFHTWTNSHLRAFTPDSTFDQGHSYKSTGFRTTLNPRQPKETPSR